MTAYKQVIVEPVVANLRQTNNKKTRVLPASRLVYAAPVFIAPCRDAEALSQPALCFLKMLEQEHTRREHRQTT
eukprot:6174181-Pleurochrysis_carterae.AAC.5